MGSHAGFCNVPTSWIIHGDFFFSDAWSHGLPYGCAQKTVSQLHPFTQPWYCSYNIYEMRAALNSAGDMTQRFSIQAQKKER